MASEPNGAYNKASIFNGENYGYWKDCMHIHINSIDVNVWKDIQNGPFWKTMTNVEGATIPKPEVQWNTKDEKKWYCDWKARNILISALGVDEYCRVSHCEIAKAVWDSLQVSHEGTNEVKQVRINTLNQQFELFHMKHGETIADMQKRFAYLINYLSAFGKSISNDIATNKILRCLDREWQPKGTTIKEANNLLNLDTTTLFVSLKNMSKSSLA